MNEYTKKFREQEYKIVEYLSSNGKTALVKDPITGNLYVKKTVDADVQKIYARLTGVRTEGLPTVIKTADDYVLIEYVNGISLNKKIARDGVMSVEEAKRHMKSLCSAAAFLHERGIIHRDITASNIIVGQHGCYLIDLGIAREMKSNKNSDTQILGTVGYAAPEQFGFNQSDDKTDIYALGVVFNYMLTGALPNERLYCGEESRIIRKCVEIDSRKRYKNVIALKRALEKNTVKSNPFFVYLSAVLAIVCVFMFAWNVSLMRKTDKTDTDNSVLNNKTIYQGTSETAKSEEKQASNQILSEGADYVSTVTDDDANRKYGYATLEKYNKIEVGMSYDEVVAIMGCEGELYTQMSLKDSTVSTYKWYGSKENYEEEYVEFENGAVRQKSSYYLK
jgi:serine/threonine protein kinase